MRLGFIGLGAMGQPMARNLLRAGHRLVVHDRNEARCGPLVEEGAEYAPNPAETARASEVVFTSLPGPAEVEEVALGPGGIAEGAHPGLVYVDLSTNHPETIRRIGSALAPQGVTVLDAPVSGGPYGAAEGTLTVMVGGDEGTYRRLEPLFQALGNKIFYCGPLGSGMVCKLVNNLLSMACAVLSAEALTVGVRAGVSLETLHRVVSSSSGSNRRLMDRFPRFLFRGEFRPGFALRLALKDVSLFLDLARDLGVPTPLASLVVQEHLSAVARGWGEEDADAVVRLQEERARTSLRLGPGGA